jgi:hypothetical protein
MNIHLHAIIKSLFIIKVKPWSLSTAEVQILIVTVHGRTIDSQWGRALSELGDVAAGADSVRFAFTELRREAGTECERNIIDNFEMRFSHPVAISSAGPSGSASRNRQERHLSISTQYPVQQRQIHFIDGFVIEFIDICNPIL